MQVLGGKRAAPVAEHRVPREPGFMHRYLAVGDAETMDTPGVIRSPSKNTGPGTWVWSGAGSSLMIPVSIG